MTELINVTFMKEGISLAIAFIRLYNLAHFPPIVFNTYKSAWRSGADSCIYQHHWLGEGKHVLPNWLCWHWLSLEQQQQWEWQRHKYCHVIFLRGHAWQLSHLPNEWWSWKMAGRAPQLESGSHHFLKSHGTQKISLRLVFRGFRTWRFHLFIVTADKNC